MYIENHQILLKKTSIFGHTTMANESLNPIRYGQNHTSAEDDIQIKLNRFKPKWGKNFFRFCVGLDPSCGLVSLGYERVGTYYGFSLGTAFVTANASVRLYPFGDHLRVSIFSGISGSIIYSKTNRIFDSVCSRIHTTHSDQSQGSSSSQTRNRESQTRGHTRRSMYLNTTHCTRPSFTITRAMFTLC